MAYESYFADSTGCDVNHLLDDWRWLVGGSDFELFKVTAMGDLFLRDAHGAIQFLDMVDGKFLPFAKSEEEFASQLEDRNTRLRILGSFVVRGLLSAGRTLGPCECFSPDHPPVLGGALSSENLAPCSILVHSSILGQIHRQVRGLPPGTKVNSFKVE